MSSSIIRFLRLIGLPFAMTTIFSRDVHKMPEFHGVQGAKGTEEQGFESTPPHRHNPAKVPTSRFSIVDSWTNVKKLLKRKI